MRWPWDKRAETRRLLKQVADANARVKEVEADLKAERKSKDYLVLELSSRVMTASRQYGISERPEAPIQQQSLPPAPLTPFEESEREEFGKFAVEAGQSKEDGFELWDRRRHGELMPYERTN